MKLLPENSDKIAGQILTLVENLKLIDNAGSEVDASNITWAPPLSILPIAAQVYEKQLSVIGANHYLKTVSFPVGIDDPDSLPVGKTYIPIVRFLNGNEELIETMTSRFVRIVLDYIDFGGLIITPLSYAVDEMVNNVCEHSGSQYGWMFAQYYPKKEFLDVVILDQGIGLKAVYEDTFEAPYTDQKAIEAALEGVSIKRDKERGFGLRTTKKMITESPLNGKFLIISGSKGYFSERGRELFFDLATFQWKGVIIIMRLERTEEKFDYTDYVE